MIDLILVYNNGYRTTPNYYASWVTYPMPYDERLKFLPMPAKVKKNRYIKDAWRNDRDRSYNYYRQYIASVGKYKVVELSHGIFIDTETKEEIVVSTDALSAIMHIWRVG